jgi:hypothetical protein
MDLRYFVMTGRPEENVYRNRLTCPVWLTIVRGTGKATNSDDCVSSARLE